MQLHSAIVKAGLNGKGANFKTYEKTRPEITCYGAGKRSKEADEDEYEDGGEENHWAWFLAFSARRTKDEFVPENK